MPDIGLGVAIMTNDDVYGTPFHMIAKYRIFDAMLGLEPIKWEERCVALSAVTRASAHACRLQHLPGSPRR